MSELGFTILVIAIIGIIIVLPIALIYMGIMGKWRASVALSPAEKRRVGEIAAAHFDDPLAGTIEWVPLKFGGSPRRAYSLERTGPQSLEFRVISNLPAPKSLLMGFGLAVLFLVIEVLAEEGDLKEMFLIFLFLLVGIGLLVLLGVWFSYRRAFDLGLGLFWSTYSRVGPCPEVVFGNPPGGRRKIPRCGRIADIHSLQILSEKVEVPQQRKGPLGGYKKPPPDTYLSYELNLVLKNGVRVNVVDQGDLENLRSDAEELSSFLGIPVWDSTGEWPEYPDSVTL